MPESRDNKGYPYYQDKFISMGDRAYCKETVIVPDICVWVFGKGKSCR